MYNVYQIRKENFRIITLNNPLLITLKGSRLVHLAMLNDTNKLDYELRIDIIKLRHTVRTFTVTRMVYECGNFDRDRCLFERNFAVTGIGVSVSA